MTGPVRLSVVVGAERSTWPVEREDRLVGVPGAIGDT
ncbi:hypothetical protein GZL_07726 [Streptomyces sp. 769]|nr:hypothetical protein GZL_07726 [Streptomyces sp. 769]